MVCVSFMQSKKKKKSVPMLYESIRISLEEANYHGHTVSTKGLWLGNGGKGHIPFTACDYLDPLNFVPCVHIT